MKSKILIFTASISTALFSTQTDFDSLIESYRTTINLPSICVSVCSKDAIIHKEAYGYKNLEEKIPATVETLYPLGSISKSFTSILFGMCCDDGIIDFDDKISDLIPFFRLNNQTVTDEITIRDYLSHQSGYGAHDTLWYNQRYSRGEIVQKLKYIPEIFPHRRTFFYQNIGYMVATHALECRTGSSWEELVTDRILKPLQLDHTYLDVQQMKTQADFAYGYIDMIEQNERTPYIDPYTIAPSGGICSNLEDLTRWTQFFLRKGEDLLEDATFKEICSPQIVTNLIAQPQFGLDSLIQMESYGLGLFITSYQGKKLIFHGGNIQGFSSLMAFVPEDDIGISIIVNKDRSIAPFLVAISILEKTLGLKEMNWLDKYKMFREYEKNSVLAGREHEDHGRVKDTTPSHTLEDFTGTFTHPGYGECEVVLVDGDLKATYNGLEFPLEHWHYDVFSSLKDCENILCRNIKFCFNSNFSGDVNTLSVIFEPESDAISFIRKAGKKLFCRSYLERFAGKYSYYGVGFSIDLEEDHIVVKAPGQPHFPLVPEKNLVFSVSPVVEGAGAYSVEFTEDEEGNVNCVQLIQPNGSIFSAYKYE